MDAGYQWAALGVLPEKSSPLATPCFMQASHFFLSSKPFEGQF